MVDAILEEAGKFATEVLVPLNAIGDQKARKLEGRQGHHARRASRTPTAST